MEIPEQLLRQIVNDIKGKKELEGIINSFIEAELLGIISRDRKLSDFFSSADNFEKMKKSRYYRQIMKNIRKTMRKSVGVFINPAKLKDFDSLLLKHESTRERMGIYPELYQRIFHITGSPGTILDLGCGINPLSYKYLKITPRYLAYDVNAVVIGIVDDFFKKKKINGKAGLINLREARKKKLKLPKADICFLFKVLDSVELEKGHKLAEKLIRQIQSKWIAASFSTRTLSGKRMAHPYRGWVEQLCRRLGYFYDVLECENEIFYLIRKS